MENEPSNSPKRHSAGATVRHVSPFHELQSCRNDFELTREFKDKWTIPFYLNLNKTDQNWIDQFIAIKPEITTDVIQKSLGDFNWRTRHTGAFFAAITNRKEFIDVIGVHLLKSELCCAGNTYCKVLASFNLPSCVDYLNQYLDYYLTRLDRPFDQRSAMVAVSYLDKVNGTQYFEQHRENWAAFAESRRGGGKEIDTSNLEKQLDVIRKVREYAT